jgi:hypothetical protein
MNTSVGFKTTHVHLPLQVIVCLGLSPGAGLPVDEGIIASLAFT